MFELLLGSWESADGSRYAVTQPTTLARIPLAVALGQV